MSRRPFVLVPGYPRLRPGRIERWSAGGVAAPSPYVDGVQRAGGQEVIVEPVGWSEDEAGELLARCDGLLLIGGGDIAPEAFGELRQPEVYGVNAERDAGELALVRAALAMGVPTLAICRGVQVLNVALGGTLDQHISGRPDLGEHGVPGDPAGARSHNVSIELDSRLGIALGEATACCSCHHHQAVARVGSGLRVVARAADGVIEALEPADRAAPWVLGVQWHPEDTAGTDPVQQRLFDALVAQART